MATTNINCLGVILVKGSASPDVTLLASEQTNSLQQSIVRVNVDSRLAPVTINLPSIASYRGNWGILQVIITDAGGQANVNNITIAAFNDGIDPNTIEGKPAYVMATNGESVRLTVAYDGSYGTKPTWDLA
jgi:hypothetical protein